MAIEFCNEYLSNVEAIGLPKRVSTTVIDDFDKIEQIVFTVSKDLLCQAHKYVLNNTYKVQSYINDHLNYVRHIDLSKSKREKWINIINRSLTGSEIELLIK